MIILIKKNINQTNAFEYDGINQVLDKGIVIHDKPFVSASNVFILSNPEDLPNGFELICFNNFINYFIHNLHRFKKPMKFLLGDSL